MRIAVILIACLLSAGCTSMLLGNRSSGQQSTTSGSQSETDTADDDAISASIRQAFSADPKLSQYAIKIRTVNGHAIISGTVGSYSARDRVVELASGIDGLTSVSYRIGVNTKL